MSEALLGFEVNILSECQCERIIPLIDLSLGGKYIRGLPKQPEAAMFTDTTDNLRHNERIHVSFFFTAFVALEIETPSQLAVL